MKTTIVTIQRPAGQLTVVLPFEKQQVIHILEETALLHNGLTTYQIHEDTILNPPDPE